LGLGSWWYFLNGASGNASFFGNASSSTTISDLAAEYYSDPYIILAGSDGSDVLGFNGTGLYLVQFQFNTNSETNTFNSVDVGAVSTLSDITLVSGSKNTTDTVAYSFISYDLFYALDGGTITFPDKTSLLTLYGAFWDGSNCQSLSIIRLS